MNLQRISIIFSCGEYGGRYNKVSPWFIHLWRLALNFFDLWNEALSRTTTVGLDKLFEKSSKTSMTLSLLTLPSAIYDFKVPFFDRNPSTFILFTTSDLTTAVVPMGVHNLGMFEVWENPLSSK